MRGDLTFTLTSFLSRRGRGAKINFTPGEVHCRLLSTDRLERPHILQDQNNVGSELTTTKPTKVQSLEIVRSVSRKAGVYL
jgi:hypothetical protein